MSGSTCLISKGIAGKRGYRPSVGAERMSGTAASRPLFKLYRKVCRVPRAGVITDTSVFGLPVSHRGLTPTLTPVGDKGTVVIITGKTHWLSRFIRIAGERLVQIQPVPRGIYLGCRGMQSAGSYAGSTSSRRKVPGERGHAFSGCVPPRQGPVTQRKSSCPTNSRLGVQIPPGLHGE